MSRSSEYVNPAAGNAAGRQRTGEFLKGLKDTQKENLLRTTEGVALMAVVAGYGRYRNAKKVH